MESIDLTPPPLTSTSSGSVLSPLILSELPPVVRLDGDAFAYMCKPSSLGITAGATNSVGIFTHNGKRYYGKGTIMDDQPYALREALKEVFANSMYRHFGCHAQQLVLSEQKWLPGSERFSSEVTATSGVHLMTEWIDGFTPFGPFVAQQLLSTVWPPLPDMFVVGKKRVLPVRGLGQIIAVGMLVNDTDCIGGTGGNVGYTIVTDSETNAPIHAQAIKIDPGQSFRYAWKEERQSQARYKKLLSDALAVISTGMAHVCPGPRQSYPVKLLPPSVVEEFRQCVSSITAHSSFSFKQLASVPGMEALFPTDDDMSRCVDFLESRRLALESTFCGQNATQQFRAQLSTSVECLESIKAGYTRAAVLMDPVTGVNHAIEGRFVNLSLLDKQEKEEDEDDERPYKRGDGGRVALVNSFEAIRAKKTDIAVQDLFLRCTGSNKRVNMSGGAGVGKSTCCQSIVSRWAAGLLFNEFELVLWVPLRRLTSARYPSGDRYTVIDVIIQECLGLYPSPQLRDCVGALYTPEKSLWILDGFDEIVGRVPDQLSAAFDEMLASPNRILTGRPHAMTGLSGVLTGDVNIEVAGFKDANIEEFVEKFARSADWPGDVLLHQLQRSRLVWDLAHVPVNLVLLCHVFAEAGTALDELALTDLYARVESLMSRRYCAKLGEDVTALTAERQSELATPVFNWISEIAYQAMKAGAVMIPGSSISSWLTAADATGDVQEIAWSAFQASGLLVQADGDAGDPLSANFHFLHLTLQEYFAAKRIAAALCGNAPLPAVEMDWLYTHKYGFHLEVLWWFVGGLVGRAAHAGAIVGLSALSDLWNAEPRDVGRVFEARVWLRMIEEGRLWRLRGHSEVAIVADAMAFARPYVIDRRGVAVMKQYGEYSKDAVQDTIRDALEQCPLLCNSVILSDPQLAPLARADFRNAVRLLGKCLLYCDWVWPLVRAQLLKDGMFYWKPMLPELFDRPEFFAVLRECTYVESEATMPVRHPELTLPQLLSVDSSAVAQWLQTLLSYNEPTEIYGYGLKLLAHIGPARLLAHTPVVDCLRGSLTSRRYLAQDGIADIMKPLGPALLDIEWLTDWCEVSLESHLTEILTMFESVGERGLSCDWLLTAVSFGIANGWRSGAEEAVAVMSSMMPFLRKCGRTELLSDWLTAVTSLNWLGSLMVGLKAFFRLCPVPLLEVEVVVSLLKRSCASTQSFPIERFKMFAALMECCGPALLGCDWYVDWLSRTASSPARLEFGVRSLRGMGSALLTCSPAVAVLQAGLSSGNSHCRTVTAKMVATLCADPQFRQSARVLDWLHALVLDKSNAKVRNAYRDEGNPVVTAAGEEAVVSKLVADGLTGLVAPSFARLRPGCGEVQQYALDIRILRDAWKHACISFSRDVLIVESSAGRFEQRLSDSHLLFMQQSCEASFMSDSLGGGTIDDIAANVFMSAGCLHRLYARMDAHPDSVDVQIHGCEVIVRLACRLKWFDAIVSSGGLVRLFTVMAATL